MDIGYIPRRMANDVNAANHTKTALKVESGISWTYRDLHLRSNVYANKLRELGVQKGDRVGILLYNCLEYFGLYFAIGKIGAIAVRLNFRLSSAEFEYALNDSDMKVLCFHSEIADRLQGIRDKVPVERYICLLYKEDKEIPSWAESWDILESGSEEEVDTDQIKQSDPVMIMYTSGTTGRPKGAVWSHDTTLWFSAMQALKWNFTGQQTVMTMGPLYHVGSYEDVALPALLMGGTVVFCESQGIEISKILNVLKKENITHFAVFPFMFYEMLNSPEFTQDQYQCLSTIITGGDPVLPWALERLKERFPQTEINQVYGLTEGTPYATVLDSEDAFRKSHSVGKPLPLVEIKVIDDAGNLLPNGEVGEIAIKSPANAVEYWRKPEATKETFVNFWCHTGDLGVIDEDGFLSIAGRKKDMIRSGGENIYAAEIEDVLYRHVGVKEAAIIGIPDEKYIEAVCAVIVKKEGAELTEKEVINYCKEYLASYKKPKKVCFVDELPRTPSHKVKKYVLREQFGNL